MSIRKPWSEEDFVVLDCLYGRFPVKSIAEITGHPYDSVKSTARVRGLARYRRQYQRGPRIGGPSRNPRVKA